MPTATAPIGKPAATKTTGFVKPGLSRQTGGSKEVEDEEEESPGLQPVHLGISVLALLLGALLAYTVFSTDQTPNRHNSTDYFFGEPNAAPTDSPSAVVSADDDEEENSSSAAASDDDEDDEDED